MQTYIRNVFGGAENLEASASLGTRTKHAYNVNLSAPLTRDLRTRGEFSMYSAEKDFTDEERIQSVYYKEVEELLKKEVGAKRVFIFDHTIRSVQAARTSHS